MSKELTFSEAIELRDALREIFRSPVALEQVVFEQFKLHLSQIAEDDSYREVIISLILWAENSGKTVELIARARTENPGNSRLRNFEQGYTFRRRNDFDIPSFPERVLAQELRTSLVDALLMVPTTSEFSGRSALLIGLPHSGGLGRSPHSARADLELILDQLDGLGELARGSWPLLLVIDNALGYLKGYKRPAAVLERIRDILVERYKGT